MATRGAIRAKGFDGFVFSRTIGVKHWCCPQCNQVNRTTVRPQVWIVQCSNEACHKRWAIGEVFYELSLGKQAPPPDTLLPIAGETMGFREPVNRVYCYGCAEVIYREGFKRDISGALPAGAFDSENRGALGALPHASDSNSNEMPAKWGEYERKRWEKIANDARYPKGYAKLRKKGWQREAINEDMGS